MTTRSDNPHNYGRIIHVHFFKDFEGKSDYYFGSLQAIYTRFTPIQIGCCLYELYQHNLDNGPFKTEECLISRGTVIRVPHKSK